MVLRPRKWRSGRYCASLRALCTPLPEGSSTHYSPKCLEDEFCKLRLRGCADRRVANVSIGGRARFDASENRQMRKVASLSAEALSSILGSSHSPARLRGAALRPRTVLR